MKSPIERLDWDDLRVFLDVARVGSLTRAAHALKVDHSTVSRRLTRLEHSVGATLFERRLQPQPQRHRRLQSRCKLADIIVAGETARFGQPEINIGILPGDGATQRLTRVGGKSLAMLMVLTGEPISAHHALQAGLIAEVVTAGQANARALDIAQAIARKPPRAAELAKAAILAAFQTTLDAGLEFERQAIQRAFATHDQAEGMNAFFEKRQPIYRGE